MKRLSLILLLVIWGCSGSSKGSGNSADTSEATDLLSAADVPEENDTGQQPTDSTTSEDSGNGTVADALADSESKEDSGGGNKPLVLPDGLTGVPVAGYPAAPAFSGVVNTENDSVDASALTGHWTVLWFYPLANTFG